MLTVPICTLLAGIGFILLSIILYILLKRCNFSDNSYWFAPSCILFVFGVFTIIVAIVGGIGNILRR